MITWGKEKKSFRLYYLYPIPVRTKIEECDRRDQCTLECIVIKKITSEEEDRSHMRARARIFFHLVQETV